MKITYLYHSGFAIEGETFVLILDYYTGAENIIAGLLASRIPLYVLVTHSHADHFNPDILTWKDKHPDIHYIFSSELYRRVGDLPDVTYLKTLEDYHDDRLNIRAFGSTDTGGSFLIESDGIKVFHAGDLNNWHWKDESTPQEVRQADSDYLHELGVLAKYAPSVDVVMFPVDARMGTDYMLGAVQFIEEIQVKVFIPMHFTAHPEAVMAFREEAAKRNVQFVPLMETGEGIEFVAEK